MGQMWHSVGSTLAVIAIFAIACGDGQGDSGGDTPDPDGMTPGGEGNAGESEGSDEAVLDFAIDGHGVRAELRRLVALAALEFRRTELHLTVLLHQRSELPRQVPAQSLAQRALRQGQAQAERRAMAAWL